MSTLHLFRLSLFFSRLKSRNTPIGFWETCVERMKPMATSRGWVYLIKLWMRPYRNFTKAFT